MPTFIPNQPITFGNVAQPCLNSDNRAYAVLMQGEEKWKLQIENTPCDGEEGSLCDVDMNEEGEFLISSQFDSITYWDTLNDVTVYPTFGYAVLYVDAGSFNEAYMAKAVVPRTACGDPIGRTYKLRFNIVNASIAGSCTFYVVAEKAGACDDPAKLYQGFPFTGLNEMYVYVPNSYTRIAIGLNGTDGDFVRMSEFTLQEVAPCWEVEMDIDTTKSCNNAVSFPAWTYGQSGGQGFFTSVPGWDSVNPVVYPYNTLSVCTLSTLAINDALELTYTISGRTAGEIYPVLGTTAGIIRNTNGTFTEFIIDDVGSDHLQFWTDADFDGTISIVSGKLYANCHTFDVIDANTGTAAATEFTPAYVGSKIEMVFNPQSIPGISGGLPNDFALTTGCYQIRFNDCCTGESYLSDTVINYTTDEHECTVLVDATCDDQAFGFDFSNEFSLTQRLRLLRFNPIYKNEGEDGQGSDGVKRRPFARSEKVYNCIFDYCDEPTHDAINTQLLCDNLTLDGVEYFCPVKDYQPEWADRGKLNLAQSQVELQRKQSVIFNRNCI